MNENQTNFNDYCRYKMIWASLKNFSHCFFHWQIWRSKSCHTNLGNFPIVYTSLLIVKINNSTLKVVISYIQNLVSKSYHALLAELGRIWGLRLTMLLLFTQPYIITLLPSNEKSFTLNDWFGKSDLPWSFEPRNLSGEKFTNGLAVAF